MEAQQKRNKMKPNESKINYSLDSFTLRHIHKHTKTTFTYQASNFSLKIVDSLRYIYSFSTLKVQNK